MFLDEGWGTSGGVSYFANFSVNLDQWEEKISDVLPFLLVKNSAKKFTLPLTFTLHVKRPTLYGAKKGGRGRRQIYFVMGAGSEKV